ncbi:MAG TPA: NAD(P)-dependent oxidoreductase [Actinomycetota bacterium]|nr:NAD(P)-dependent oxidoreductase [Actinomycetota bacterium]
MQRVAVVGVGAMGGRVARRLLGAGHDVVVWNRTPSKAEALASEGAAVAATPSEAAGSADAVLTMVADPSALEAVTGGPDGIAAGARPGALVAEMSTVGPPAIRRLRAALPDEVELVDAPVLGSLSEVEGGALRIFVGGTPEAYERVRSLFEPLGSPLHAGPLGAGAAAKLVANSTLFGSLGVLGEAVALADALGLDRATTFEVLAGTPVAAQAERRRGALESGEFPLRFALSLALKDAGLVVEAAYEAGADLRLGAAARSWLADAVAAGLGESDYSRLLEHVVARVRRTT